VNETDPTFSDEEGRRILARAAEREASVEAARLDSGKRMTLDDLTAIAEEVDIDVGLVRAAADELVLHRDAPPSDTVLGVPKEVRAVRVLGGRVSDPQWEQMVGVFRERFGAHGVVSQFGDVREWASSDGSVTNPVRVRLEPREDGTLVTIRQLTHTLVYQSLSVVPGIFAALFSALMLRGEIKPSVWVLSGIFWALVPLHFVAARVLGRRQNRKQRELFDSVADKMELIGRAEGA
jgi:hypothetical protein